MPRLITARSSVVLKPKFQVYNGGSDYRVDDGTLPKIITCFDYENFDIGSCYDTSNDRYTVKYPGRYYFYAHFRMGAPGKVRVFRAALYKNGSYIDDLATFGGSHNYDGSTGYDHPACAGSTIHTLEAGDYIELYVSGEVSSDSELYIQNGQRSHWGGFLMDD